MRRQGNQARMAENGLLQERFVFFFILFFFFKSCDREATRGYVVGAFDCCLLVYIWVGILVSCIITEQNKNTYDHIH